MKITCYGHACFLIEAKGVKLLFDPFISPNPLTKGIVDANKVEADYILISHGHEDHVADAIQIAKRTGATIISNFEITTWFQSQGVEKVHGMNIGGSFDFPFGKVKYVSAIHSSVLPDGTYGGNPGGFVLSMDDKEIYYAGDTALTYDMKLIKKAFDLDLAFLPIGDNFTMGVDDAVIAAKYVGTKHIVGMHYNTFPPIEIDTENAIATFEAVDKKLTLIQIGESIEI